MDQPERELCECYLLRRAANEPRVPIVFDATHGEYHLQRRDNDGYEILQYCPFCGGRAPQSKRTDLFQQVSQSEKDRLREEYFDKLHTIDDVRRTLGEPDEEFSHGMSWLHAEEEGKPDREQTFPVLNYRNLSQAADVGVVVYPSGSVEWMITGKPMKKSKR